MQSGARVMDDALSGAVEPGFEAKMSFKMVNQLKRINEHWNLKK
jgi:hypothetical protein